MRSEIAGQNVKGRAQARPFSIAYRRWGLLFLFMTIAIGLFLAPPRSLLGKCDLVAYALCHRIPSHSFHVGGRQLPLCARCTGTYLGALWGFSFMAVRGRRRASRLPPVPILVLLLGFFLFQAVDGVNSFLTLFPGLPHLYEPHNLLRFATGALNGLTISALVIPLFNSALWRAPGPDPSIRGWLEMGVLLLGVGGLLALMWLSLSALLYPLALGSMLAVLLTLTLVNAIIVTTATGREGQAESWGQAWTLLLSGLYLTLLEVAALVLLRGLLTRWLAFP